MNLILFDDSKRTEFLPLAFTKPVADFRFGILTVREKWEHAFNQKSSSLTQTYLQHKFPSKIEDENVLINGRVCPNTELIEEIQNLEQNSKLEDNGVLIAVNISKQALTNHLNNKFDLEQLDLIKKQSQFNNLIIETRSDLFAKNGAALTADFEVLTKSRKSGEISATNHLLGENIFVEEGAQIECSTLNSSTGPIYIGKNAEVMEGCLIRGPFALGENSTLKMGSKIYGPTTIGPHSKVGGEVNNSVLFGYSNKAHDGFLGNSIIGEWCNLGADTNTSNLKNNYGEVKTWNYATQSYQGTTLQFHGLIMGDHSKCSINTMFNTGTVTGVSANIFGGGFPPKFIPSYSWGGKAGFETFNIEKAIQLAQTVAQRRSINFNTTDEDILQFIYTETAKFRKG